MYLIHILSKIVRLVHGSEKGENSMEKLNDIFLFWSAMNNWQLFTTVQKLLISSSHNWFNQNF